MKTVTVPEGLLQDILDNVGLLSLMGQSTDTLDAQVERMRRLTGSEEAPERIDTTQDATIYQFRRA